MATYNKFYDYTEQLAKAKHDWSSHVYKAMFSSVAPVATNALKGDLTDITAGNGYTAGGQALDSITVSETTGTTKLVIADEVFSASGGAYAAARYASIYNDTTSSPAKPLVCWFDYGSSFTLADGESMTLDFDATNGLWQMA